MLKAHIISVFSNSDLHNNLVRWINVTMTMQVMGLNQRANGLAKGARWVSSDINRLHSEWLGQLRSPAKGKVQVKPPS